MKILSVFMGLYEGTHKDVFENKLLPFEKPKPCKLGFLPDQHGHVTQTMREATLGA